MKKFYFQVKTFHYRVNILKIQNSSVPLAKSGFQYLTVVKNWFLNFLLQGPDVGDFNSWIFRTPQGSPITLQLSFSWVRTFFSNPLQPTVLLYLLRFTIQKLYVFRTDCQEIPGIQKVPPQLQLHTQFFIDSIAPN